ncbi:MAG TPA: MFS transporter [Opitutaceae bacterium]|nr:MFS transporter [Opitutaceae bacterium]
MVAPADLRVLFAARVLRMFAYGMLGVVLVLFLVRLGFGGTQAGLLLTLTLLGDVAISLWLAAHADRWGRRRTLILGAALMALGGAAMAASGEFAVLVLAATIGVISPTGAEVGPFQSIEQACLAQAVTDRERTRVFAWYNLAGYFASALGALAVGGWVLVAQRGGWTDLAAYRAVLLAYAGAGLVLAVLSSRLTPAIEAARAHRAADAGPTLLGLRESRGVVLRLSALFALDSLGGGFVLQSFLAWWFQQKFGVSEAALGVLFFGTNLLSGVSGLVAVPLARRFGLINTMVWTHLPSNVLLMLVPFMPTLPLAVAVLLARHVLSQMDVPTRQSYVNAIVPAGERSAANGVTSTAKQLGTAFGPVLAGKLFGAAAATALPFLVCGILKSSYDLLLWRAFRKHRAPEER